MNIEAYVVCFVIGILMCVIISYVPFIDLIKILPVKPKEYKEHKKIKENTYYKNHVKKWRRYFLFNVIIYAVVFNLAFIIAQKILLSFLIGIIISVVYFGIISKKESKAKTVVEELILNKATKL